MIPPRASLPCGRYPLCVAPHQAGRQARQSQAHAQEQPQRPRPEHRRRAYAVDRLAQAHNLIPRDSRATICYGGLLLSWIGLSAKDLSRVSRHPA